MAIEEDNVWQRVANGVYVGMRGCHPAFGYIIERRRDGKWIVRCPDGSILCDAQDEARICRTANGAALYAFSDGLDARGFGLVTPRKGDPV
jgi:hypothetical protein